MKIIGTIKEAEKITGTIKEAEDASGLGRTKLYEKIGDGTLQIVKVGRRTLVRWDSLRAMLEAA